MPELKSVPTYDYIWHWPTPEFDRQTRISREAASRSRGADPLEGKMWSVKVELMRYPNRSVERDEHGKLGFPERILAVSGDFADHSLRQKPDDFWRINEPWHIGIPFEASILAAEITQAHGGQMTMSLRKWGHPYYCDRYKAEVDYSTTYLIKGGTLRWLLDNLFRAGHKPPRTHWHMSM